MDNISLAEAKRRKKKSNITIAANQRASVKYGEASVSSHSNNCQALTSLCLDCGSRAETVSQDQAGQPGPQARAGPLLLRRVPLSFFFTLSLSLCSSAA